MSGAIECAGTPRDQGLDQGLACRAAVRGELRGLRRVRGERRWRLARGFRSRRDADVVREIRRHFPQVYERADGLARGAGVPRRSVLERLAWELGGPSRPGAGAGALVAAAASRTRGGALVAKALDLPPDADLALVLRRTRHDPGHVCLEATLASLPAAVAGVNEAGLAMAVVAHPELIGDAPAPPPLLLVADCLQRFETVARALDWCAARPAAAGATLVAADAGGGLAAVELGAAGVRLRSPVDGLLLVEGGRKLAPPSGTAGPVDLDTLRRILAAPAAPDAGAAGLANAGVVWLDPAGRRVGLSRGAADRTCAEDVAFLPVA